ncbi:DUF802 domain-containing protein [Achromobacter aegrifaciens]|uniref:DUF802 domain-containing protein n=1 Tax=Achromobacter aegrifaciens TaxID=1287736 RepID=A0ABU2DAX9_ACHAE|nr:DUF802 domain-containing protein [Achromobacter aegrifaciens]MDR7945282.1 DUF802 domain-containing protein [Achromobacter aegrifaciens]
MSKYLTNLVVFLAGLAVVGWIGVGYAGTNPLALAVTLLIVVCYLAGALELLRYQQATSSLTRALSGLSEAPGNLGSWLDQLPPGLRNAARLRIEGERAGLPGPALTPYLVGLLVLLGMLGTFLGMVVTLRGTGLALESATDLAAIRASLAAPVKGLGFAFGTSIAGVASSAMLGLLAALCRRERVRAAQLLDSKAATTLRVYSQGYQREESFKLLQRQAEVMQRQAEAMPTLVDKLQAMMSDMARQNQALSDRHMASQDAFQGKAEAAYSRLAAVMEQSMKESVSQSARSAGAALQPVVEATMASLSRETASLQDTVTQAVQRQLEGLTSGFQATTSNVAGIWNQALAGQQRASEALSQDLRASLDHFAQTFEQRSAALLDSVSSRLEESSGSMSQAWTQALSRQEQASEKLAGDNLQALTAAAASFEQHSASLLRTLNQSHTLLQSELASRDQQRLAAWTDTLGAMGATLRQEWEQSGAQAAERQEAISATLAQTVRDITAQAEVQARLLEGVSARMEAAANGVSEQWATALARQEQAGEKLAGDNREALAAAAATFEQHSAALLQTLDQSHTQLQAALASRDQERLAAWTGTLTAMAATLSQEWQQAGADTVARQQAASDTLAQTARDIAAQTQAQAGMLESVSARLETAAGSVTQAWTEAQARQEQANAKLAGDNQQALETAAATFEQHSAALLQTLNQSHAELQAALASRDQERLAAWTGTLTAMAAKLGQEWEQAGTQAALRQLEVNDTLAQTARDVSAQTQAQAGLLESVSTRLETAATGVTQAWTEAQARQEQANAKLAGDTQQALETAAAAFEQHSAALLQTLDQSHAELQAALASRDQERLTAWTGTLTAMAAKLGQEWEQAGTQAALRQLEVNDTLAQTARDITAQTQAQAGLLESVSARLETAATGVTQAWTEAQARQEQANAKLAGDNQQALEAAAAAFEQHSAALLQTLEQSQTDLQNALAAEDEARLEVWTGKLGTIADSLRTEWEQTSSYTANQQQQICDTLAITAQDISAQTQASANDTIAEIGRLVQAASEAPRAAAEVIGELRQKLSDSMERDNDMLEERNRLLETLGTLLDAVNHTAAEQRTAVDALVSSSAELLDRVGTQFTEQAQAETGKLAEVAAQVASGAAEVASLGESFGTAVQLFGESNDKLVAHLQRIEAALDKSIARGDEQLAYYVAQAREVVDLSMVSQKQIIENLQQLAIQRATAGAEAA